MADGQYAKQFNLSASTARETEAVWDKVRNHVTPSNGRPRRS